MEEFLKDLGITQEPIEVEGVLVIDIESSEDYGRIYSKLDRSDLVDEDEESSYLTANESSIQFVSDDYIITLISDFENDTYKLTIKER